MKAIVTALTVLVSAQAFAGLASGKYQGEGMFRGQSGQGGYKTTTEITGDSVKTTYTLPDGSKREWNFKMVAGKDGNFKLLSHDVEVGRGYCLAKTDVCHYELQIAKLQLEETLVVQEGKLYRFGSKDEGSGRILWQEALKKN